MENDNEEVEEFTMGNISAIDLADEALGNLDNNDIFCTGKVRLQMAQEKAKLSGQPVVKHRNGKGNLLKGIVIYVGGCGLICGPKPKTVPVTKVLVIFFLYFNLKQNTVFTNNFGTVCNY